MPDVPPTWPLGRLGEALQATAIAAGLPVHDTAPPAPDEGRDQDRWFTEACAKLGLEAQAVHALHGELAGVLPRVGPALVQLPGEGEPRFLALVGRDWRRRIRVLGPDGAVLHLPAPRVRAMLCRGLEDRVRPDLEAVLAAAHLPGDARALEALVSDTLAATPITGFQIIRAPVNRAFRARFLAGPARRLALLVAVSALEYLALLLAWWLVGKGALAGRLEPGWLSAWMLALLCLVPLRMAAVWLRGSSAVEAGVLLKQRLYAGLTRLRPDEIRHLGVGQLISRVLESEAVEHLGLTGGLELIVAAVELLFAAWVLAQGAGGGAHVALLGLWSLVLFGVTWRYARHRHRWAEHRLAQSHQLVEAMVGQRTRVVQLSPDRWHQGEDAALARYLRSSRAMDRWAQVVMALPVRGWVILGILALAPAVMGIDATPTALAISLGGVLLAASALERVTWGVSSLVDAGISWGMVASLFAAAARPEPAGSPLVSPREPGAPGTAEVPLLELRELRFTHTGRSEPAIAGLDLDIRRGERLLLEGSSGGGKSTLVALLTGLREPDDGLLLLGGLDRASVGAVGWRSAIAAAPQFHENHVFAGTLAFNLLMGRRWPPREEDLEDAHTICLELGLGPLLERMPSGLFQLVGESGWQLSHGERSRVFLARALLQGAELVLLDETFAALDPDSLDRALQCALRRAPTLLVVAHP